MHKIDSPSATSENDFTDGNEASGVLATEVWSKWLNTIQRELVAIVLAGGGSLDDADDAQVLANIQALMQSAGRLRDIQYFDVAGNHTYTKPAWLNSAVVEVCGGGGGGGGAAGNGGSGVGAGGGGGGYARRLIPATAISGSMSVTVGAGGSGGSHGSGGTPTDGGDGGLSTFSSLDTDYRIQAAGGSGGAAGADGTNIMVEGGLCGSGTYGDVTCMGGSGGNAGLINGYPMSTGCGGDSFFAGGGRQRLHVAGGVRTGATGEKGSGGSGGSTFNATAYGAYGGAGGAGIVIIYEFE